MSQWGTLDASFATGRWMTKEVVERGTIPRGSESGPDVFVSSDEKTLYVTGRLRDVDDYLSPAVLAWFIKTCGDGLVDWADLLWELDDGPRYRYEWRQHQLQKIKGILD